MTPRARRPAGWILGLATATVVVAVTTVAAVARDAQQGRQFRAVADLVLVPVSVTDGNRPVTGLTADDFELLDNGVPQVLTSTTMEPLPIDVTLVLDTSGSVEGDAVTRFKAGVQEIVEDLQPNDRVRLITFATDVADAFGLQPGGAPLPVDRLRIGGATSFYNGLAAALITVPPSDRPQLLVAFSDGLDNMSFLGALRISALAGHSSAVLYISLLRRDRPLPLRGLAPWTGQPDRRTLREAAEKTGGNLYEDRSPDAIPDVFRQVIDEFRTKYLLRYTPRGVDRDGWHEIAVRVKNRPYQVRARSGYEGG